MTRRYIPPRSPSILSTVGFDGTFRVPTTSFPGPPEHSSTRQPANKPGTLTRRERRRLQSFWPVSHGPSDVPKESWRCPLQLLPALHRTPGSKELVSKKPSPDFSAYAAGHSPAGSS